MAVNERLIPSGTELPSFEIRMKTRVGEVTCRPSELLIDPELAVTVVVPTETPVATPLVAEDDHVALPVRSTWDASL